MKREMIDTHHASLKRVLALVFVYVGIADDTGAGWRHIEAKLGVVRAMKALQTPCTLSRWVHTMVWDILRPLEAATRRLILLLAADLPLPKLPKLSARKAQGEAAVSHAGPRHAGATGNPGASSDPVADADAPPPITARLTPAPYHWPEKPEVEETLPKQATHPLLWPFRRRQRRKSPIRAPQFQLLDDMPPADGWVYVEMTADGQLILPQPARLDIRAVPNPQPVGDASLLRRVAALAQALQDPKREAQRLMLWRALRNRAQAAGKACRWHPLKPGLPPGWPNRSHNMEKDISSEHWSLRELDRAARQMPERLDTS